MAERYVICTRYRPGPGGFAGVNKHVWWELEQARRVAQQKLPNSLRARIFIGAVDADDTGIATGSGGCDGDERWRVIRRTPVRYIETVRHSEERIIELTEERMTARRLDFAPAPPGTQIRLLNPPSPTLHYVPHHFVIKVQ